MFRAVTVFCGSRHGHDPRYAAAARELGVALVRRGITLVWGAGRVGLMGEVADAVLAAGGHVRGVIPDFLRTEELLHPGIAPGDLAVTETLFERKRLLIESADAFVVLPGGLGTLDELFEVVTLRQLRRPAGPCGLLNVAGYFDPLLAQLERSVSEGFVDRAHVDALLVEADGERLLAALEARAAAGSP
ncbi:MAG: TIGR00730 family Rossman fold protein [Planctomycetes bacterium]|nr:TIGR00730 family Rossman fold protein [Planctomycetota bacterium]